MHNVCYLNLSTANSSLGNIKPWPIQFDPWNPKNEAASKSWFSVAHNSDFSSWGSVTADNTLAWADLEKCVKTIAGVNNTMMIKHTRNACGQVWGIRALSEHPSLEDDRDIGRKVAKEIMSGWSVAWAQEASTWLLKACTVLAPRFITLWKKWRRKGKNIEQTAEADDSSGSIASATTTSLSKASIPTATLRNKVGESEGDTVKKRKLNTSARKAVSFAAEEELTHSHKAAQSGQGCLLIHRYIVVRLDEATAEEASAPCYALVGVSAIIEDNTQDQNHKDVRCQHLSFQKFSDILIANHSAYDVANMRLVYDVSQGDNTVEEVHIQDAEDFVHAVGTLDWYAGNGDSEELLMRIARQQYRY